MNFALPAAPEMGEHQWTYRRVLTFDTEVPFMPVEKFPFWLLIIAFSGTKLLHPGMSKQLSAVLCSHTVGFFGFKIWSGMTFCNL